MTLTGRHLCILPWLALAFASAGCSQSSPFLSGQTMTGRLKASVSQLEFENEKLKKELGEIKAENDKLDTELAREREVNGEITARLDDAKDMIRKQGGSFPTLGSRSRNVSDDEIPPPDSGVPRARTTKGRKPPSASIPAPTEGSTDSEGFGSSGDGFSDRRRSSKAARDLGDDNDDDRWLPIARGLATQVR